jgi:broad specificity phosphatase PhoE
MNRMLTEYGRGREWGEPMATVTWARHGENLANVTRTFSFRVYDESLTERGRQQARDLAAFTAVTGPVDDQVIVVAHGASIRAALPLLAAVPDPGQDLPTGGTARFTVAPGVAGARVCLISWAGLPYPT